MKNVAAILAAGTGTRFGSRIPKQFSVFNNRLLIEYTLDVFQKHAMIDEIVIAVPEGYIPFLEEIKEKNHFSKISKIVHGGSERHLSTISVLNTFPMQEEINLLLHDGARPFVSDDIISRSIDSLKEHSAVIVAVPATDTLIEVDHNFMITRIPERKAIFHAQTPQAFRLSVIRKAFELAKKDENFTPTDDGSVIFHYLPDEKILVIPGDEKNCKITFSNDIRFF